MEKEKGEKNERIMGKDKLQHLKPGLTSTQ